MAEEDQARTARMTPEEWERTIAFAVRLAEQSAIWTLQQRAIIERRKHPEKHPSAEIH